MTNADTRNDTITLDGVTYDVEREHDRAGRTLLTIEDFPGIEGRIGYDDDHAVNNPREWSNVGTMSLHYRGYDLGDEDIHEVDFTIECPACGGKGGDDDTDCARCEGAGTIDVDPVTYFKSERGARVVLPLSVYDHSGITMFVGHRAHTFDAGGWDTSYVGFTFDTPEGVRECIGETATDEQIEAALRAEVKVYASYLEGDVTFYDVHDDETGFADGCGGYVGDAAYCERECFDALAQAIVKRLAENAERAYWAARDTITTD